MNRVVVTKEQFDKMMEMAGACVDRKSNRSCGDGTKLSVRCLRRFPKSTA